MSSHSAIEEEQRINLPHSGLLRSLNDEIPVCMPEDTLNADMEKAAESGIELLFYSFPDDNCDFYTSRGMILCIRETGRFMQLACHPVIATPQGEAIQCTRMDCFTLRMTGWQARLFKLHPCT